MRIVVMPGRSFSSRERPLLQHLEIGLASEGARVIHAIPAGSRLAAEPDVFSQVVLYEANGLPLTRGIRAGHLAEKLRELPRDSEEAPIDVVHAFDDAWPIAVDVARATGAALAVDFWSAAMTRKAGAIRAAAHDLAGLVFLAPDPKIERALRREVEGVSVRLTPWGIHCPAEPRTILPKDCAPSVVVSASGSDPEALVAAVEGLALSAKRFEELVIFCDAHAAKHAKLWPVIRRLDVEDRFSMTPLMEGRRELPLRADIMVLPESLGEFKSLVLDAMGAGMAIVAADDPNLSHLQNARTAHLIAGPDPVLWESALTELLEHPDRARALGASAREFVRGEHRVSVHVATVIDAYEWMTAGDAIRIRQGGKGR